MAEIIRITDGNAFKLRITGEILLENYREAADMSVVSKLVVNFVRRGRLPQTASVDEQGRIVALNDGSLALGVYGVELTGYYNGEPWRYFSQDVFEIVDENSEANESTGDDVPMYDVTFVVSFGGDSITAAFVEAAISTHNNDEDSHPGITEELSKKVDDIMVDDESVVDVDPETGRRTVNLHKDQLGKVDDVLVNGESVLNEDNEAEITIPEKVSDLPNDADYATKSELTTGLDAKQDTITAVAEPTIADDGGNPSASVDFEDGEMAFAFRNLKLRFSDLTAADKAELKGEKGDQGDSAVYNPSDPDAPDFEMANTTGQSTTKAMTQKAVTDMHKEFTNYAFGNDETIYLQTGEIDYYAQYGYGYAAKGVAQKTGRNTTTPFNQVTIGPIKASSGTPTATYYIMKGLSYLNPANNTLLKTGTVSLTTSFQQFVIDLDNEVSLSDEYLLIYFVSTSTIAVLGIGGQSVDKFNYSFRAIFNTSGTLNATWTEGSNDKYIAVKPILKLITPPQVNAAVESLIENSPALAAKANAEDLAELESDFNDFTDDISEEHKLEGEIEYYSQYGYGYGYSKIAQRNATVSSSYKVTSVIAGPIKANANAIATYYVVLVPYADRLNIQNGTVLKTGTINVGVNFAPVRFDLEEEVTVPTGSVIAVYFISAYELTILGKNGQSIDTFSGSLKVMYGGTATTNWTEPTSSSYVAVRPICLYEKNSGCTDKVLGLIEDKKPEIVSETEASIEAVEVQLPSKIVAVVGDTLQVFYRSIVKAVDPYAYDVVARCAKGRALRRFFEYTPSASDVGTNTLTFNIYNRKGIKVGTASTQLVTVSAPISPSSQVNAFVFGDSLTDGGKWPCEALRRLTNNNSVDSIAGKGLSNIAFCGSKTNTYNSTTVHYFGAGGWNWDRYVSAGTPRYRVFVSGVTTAQVNATYTNNSVTFTILEVNITEGEGSLLLSGSGAPSASGTLTKASGNGDATIAFSSYETDSANPLWDDTNNKMTFIPYVEENGSGQMDVVYVLLSWNGKSAWSDYTVENLGYAKIFLRKLHSEYPNAKAKLLGIQMPSSQSGLGNNYGASGVYPDWYGLYMAAWSYNRSLEELCELEEFAEFCEYVDVASQFDSEYNMQGAMKKVNVRNSTTIYEHTNGVHPDTTGYYQIGDVVYRNFVKEFCQGD